MAKQSNKIIDEYFAKYRQDIIDGNISKLQLARTIYELHSNLFASIEVVRTGIRRRTGASGATNRKKINQEDIFISNIQHGMKYILPKSKATPNTPIKIKGVTKLGIFSDIHIPYHNEEAVVAAFTYANEQNIDGILLNGDLMDFYQCSRFNKTPDKATMQDEFEMTREFFSWIREIFPVIPIYFKLGNHEKRWQLYLTTKAPELFGVSEFKLENILKLEEYNITLVDDMHMMTFGLLNIVHGHEFGESTFSPVNPARGLFLRAKCNIIAGHNHQTSEHHENSIDGRNMACWSTGCLCELSPEYRPFAYTKWNHGFAIVELTDDKGGFSVSNLRIIDGKIL
jgi:predicted phosphodiesterase